MVSEIIESAFMFNMRVSMKLIATAYSCTTLEQTDLVSNWVSRLHDLKLVDDDDFFTTKDILNSIRSNIKNKNHTNNYV